MRCARAVVAVALVVVAGCAQLDDPGLLHDLRVLAVVTEPAELALPPIFFEEQSYTPTDAFALARFSVDVHVFDPRGGVIALETQTCPQPSDDEANGCDGFDGDGVLPEVTERAMLDAYYAKHARSAAPLDPLVDPSGALPFAREERLVSFAVAAHLFEESGQGKSDVNPGVVEEIAGDLGTGTEGRRRRSNFAGLRALSIPFLSPILPRLDVVASNLARPPHEVRVEHAFKRVPMFLDLFAPLPFAFEELRAEMQTTIEEAVGVPFCPLDARPPLDGVTVDGDGNVIGVDDVPLDVVLGEWPCLFPRRPNKNPTLQGILLLPPDAKPNRPIVGAGSVEPVAEIVVTRGERLTLAPSFVAPPEVHQVIGYDLVEERIVVKNVVEDYVVDFAVTAGTLERSQTVPIVDDGLGVVWLTSRDRAEGERDVLVLVVRDQRGGTGVGVLTVIYR
mgnify:CR=1 FL=1